MNTTPHPTPNPATGTATPATALATPSRRAAALTRHAAGRWGMLIRTTGPCIAGQTVRMLAFTDQDRTGRAITVAVAGLDREDAEHHFTVPLAALALPTVPPECHPYRSWYCATAATGNRPDLHILCNGHAEHRHDDGGQDRCECDVPSCDCHLRYGRPPTGPRPRAAGELADGGDLTPRVLDDSTDLDRDNYRLERLYRLGAATVRVRIRRNFYAFQSHAIAEVLTPERTWSRLLAQGPHAWHAASPPNREIHTTADLLAALDPIAQQLAVRAATVLATT